MPCYGYGLIRLSPFLVFIFKIFVEDLQLCPSYGSYWISQFELLKSLHFTTNVIKAESRETPSGASVNRDAAGKYRGADTSEKTLYIYTCSQKAVAPKFFSMFLDGAEQSSTNSPEMDEALSLADTRDGGLTLPHLTHDFVAPPPATIYIVIPGHSRPHKTLGRPIFQHLLLTRSHNSGGSPRAQSPTAHISSESMQ